jgi:hypothetical protein
MKRREGLPARLAGAVAAVQTDRLDEGGAPMRSCFRVAKVPLLLALLALLLTARAQAFEAKDSDAFILGAGSSNIEVSNSTGLLSGTNLFGGVRIGLFWTVFVELGYGAVTYSDTVLVGGARTQIDFRTTGANAGLGFLIPIRNLRLGLEGIRNPNNRWSEKHVDVATGTTTSDVSGGLNFDTYNVFAQFGQKGQFEVGVRRDRIRSTNSILKNSFGPYISWNIPLG